MLESYILESPAWVGLSPPARAAVLELLRLYNGRNNGRIALSALGLSRRMPVSRATAARLLEELTERGFLAPLRKGGFNAKSGSRRATEWRLTWLRCDETSVLPTKEFMRWGTSQNQKSVSRGDNAGFTSRQQVGESETMLPKDDPK